jgi:hypothetical protein
MLSDLPQSLVCKDGILCSWKSAIGKAPSYQPVGNKSLVLGTTHNSHLFTQRRTFSLPLDQSVMPDLPVYNMLLSLCVSLPVNFWMPEPIKTAYFLNPSHQSVCLYVCPLNIVRQWLVKHIPMALNTHNTRRTLWHISSMSCTSYQRSVCGSFCLSAYCCLAMAR